MAIMLETIRNIYQSPGHESHYSGAIRHKSSSDTRMSCLPIAEPEKSRSIMDKSSATRKFRVCTDISMDHIKAVD